MDVKTPNFEDVVRYFYYVLHPQKIWGWTHISFVVLVFVLTLLHQQSSIFTFFNFYSPKYFHLKVVTIVILSNEVSILSDWLVVTSYFRGPWERHQYIGQIATCIGWHEGLLLLKLL